MAGSVEAGNAWQWSRVRLWLGIGAGLLLLLPLLLDFPWSPGDYVVAAVLLFGSLGAYELATRLSGATAYRAGAGMAILAVFLLVWSNGAVGLTDGPADGLFLLIPALVFVGGMVARFRPGGMSWTMFAAAGSMGLIAVGALLGGYVPEFNPPVEILGIAGFFVMLFTGSGLLFREAGRDAAQDRTG